MNAFASLQIQPRHALILFAAACIPLILPAQEKPTPPETPAPAIAPNNPANPASFSYDVVSIKPFKIGPDSPMIFTSSADGLSFRGADLLNLMMNAFPTQRPDQIAGMPDWANYSSMNDERWTIEAKMDEDAAAAFKKLSFAQQQEARRSMMLQVLTDRFNLKYHKESREMPVYNLVIAKGGLKFKETPEGKKDNMMMGWGEISGDGIEFNSGLLMNLSNDSRRFVVDKTGLTGKYSFSLKWDPFAENNLPASFTDQYPQFKGRPDLFIALEEQLGLKLEPAKGPVDVYVIDHVEKPSEN